MTNGDVIREMTDEELAEFLCMIEIGDIEFEKTFCDMCDEKDCDSCKHWWVQHDCTHPQGLKCDVSGITTLQKIKKMVEMRNANED